MDRLLRRTWFVAIFLLLALTSLSATAAWEWANPLPQGNILDDVVWGGTPGEFVAVGHDGTILTSTTGAAGTWSVQKSGTTSWFQDVEWNPTLLQFIAVGTATADTHWMGAVLTSPDGIHWTMQTSNAPGGLAAVTWTGTQYVAVGAGGTIVTSPNGVDWTQRAVPTAAANSWLSGIAWNGATFVVVGAPGIILTSPDGATWGANVPEVGGPFAAADSFQSVAWNGTLFVAVGQRGLLLTSPNGAAWTRQNSGTVELLRKIRWLGGRFVVPGSNGFFMTGTDGINWTQENTTTTNLLEDFALAPNGTQVLVGKFGTILRNTGTGWQNQTIGSNAPLRGVALNGNSYVAVGDGGTILLGQTNQLTSAPTLQTSPVNQRLNDVIWDGSNYTAVGDLGAIITSPNGTTWSSVASNTTASLKSIATNGTVRTIVGSGGTILTGPVGGLLVPQNSGVTVNLNQVIWNGTQFVAVGDGGTILTSNDGSTWSSRTSGITQNLHTVAFGNGVYVAGGALFTTHGQGMVLRSADGITWSQVITGGTDTINRMVWDGARFIAATNSGLFASGIMISSDGSTWSVVPVTGNDLFAVQANGNSAVVVGDGGAVLLSTYAATVVPDTVTVSIDTPAVIPVLNNDLGTGLRITAVGPTAKGGTLTINGDGTLTYTPSTGFLGTDTFTYTIVDANGATDTGTVTVDVANVSTTSASTSTSASGGGGSSGGGGGALNGSLLLLLAAVTMGLIYRRERLIGKR